MLKFVLLWRPEQSPRGTQDTVVTVYRVIQEHIENQTTEHTGECLITFTCKSHKLNRFGNWGNNFLLGLSSAESSLSYHASSLKPSFRLSVHRPFIFESCRSTRGSTSAGSAHNSNLSRQDSSSGGVTCSTYSVSRCPLTDLLQARPFFMYPRLDPPLNITGQLFLSFSPGALSLVLFRYSRGQWNPCKNCLSYKWIYWIYLAHPTVWSLNQGWGSQLIGVPSKLGCAKVTVGSTAGSYCAVMGL